MAEVDASFAARSDAGMFGLWRSHAFDQVVDQEAWEAQFGTDRAIQSRIVVGDFVPLNIQSDGSFQFVLRGGVDHEGLTERELRYVAVSSDPYLLVSDGAVELGGIEAAGGGSIDERNVFKLAAGRYRVVTHLVDWEAEPGSQLPDGSPADSALPDFIVEILPGGSGEDFRTSVATFDPPD